MATSGAEKQPIQRKRPRATGKSGYAPPGAPSAAADSRPTEPAVREQRKRIWHDFLVGLAMTIVLTLCKVGIEHTVLGEQLGIAAYNLLQGQLASSVPIGKLPVTVVDLDKLPQDTERSSIPGARATSRDGLTKLIDAIADQDPLAIGIDVDFSPGPSDWVTPHDPAFFSHCLELEKERDLRVFLGIWRTQARPPQLWLGISDFRSLAANISVPDEHPHRNMIRWSHGEDITARGRTLCGGLAQVIRDHTPGSLPLPDWIVAQFSEENPVPGIWSNEFLVDYGPVEALMDHAIPGDPAAIHDFREQLTNKIVLVGYGTVGRATDMFDIPGHPPVPGVYLHACAVYTLANAPLYHLTFLGRMLVDIGLPLYVLLMVGGIRWHYNGKTTKGVNTARAIGLFTIVVVMLCVVLGVFSVPATRIMWDDFLLALPALAMHPAVGGALERWYRRMRDWFSRHPPFLDEEAREEVRT